ncbi:MAG TPA: MFS transporter [Anaerolineaceae bacterium]|nr:MFS transporter [Anaerolineaceae bacterium]
MEEKTSKNRWSVVVIFFIFMLLHQSDKLLISPLTTPIMNTFGIDEAQMGFIFSGAVIVGAICYPLWGYLFDRYGRAKLLALASFIWGATTWLSAIAPTFPLFVASRASTGIDDSSYPGLYSLIADYFPPKTRGKIYGFLQITSPIGYMVGMVLALTMAGALGWRSVFYLTGSLGIVLAVVIFFGVKEAPRGGMEPELAGVNASHYHFSWKEARELFKKPSLMLLFAQGFFGVFPWQVITFWFFRYLETERGYNSNEVMITMVLAVGVLAAGYPIGGAIGDWLYKRNLRGRLYVSAFGVIAGAAMLWVTLSVPYENHTLFIILLSITALFIPFAAPNVLSTVYDVTVPEIRSTANAIQNFIEQGGSALAPTLAGLIAVNSSLENAILILCISAWVLCFLFFLGTIYLAPRDIKAMRAQLQARAEMEKQLAIESSQAKPETLGVD